MNVVLYIYIYEHDERGLHRYLNRCVVIYDVSVSRSLCDRLQKEAGFKKRDIPELPKRNIIENLSQKTIGERAEKLNQFLDAAVKAEHLQWGIKVDDTIAVYKRRVKKPGTATQSLSSRQKNPSRRPGPFSSQR